MRTRTCVGCRRRRAQDELIRIVHGPDGGVRLDPRGGAPGRGAYVCPDVRCFEQALRRGRLGRALRAEMDDEDRERLREAFRARMGVQ